MKGRCFLCKKKIITNKIEKTIIDKRTIITKIEITTTKITIITVDNLKGLNSGNYCHLGLLFSLSL